MLVATAALSPVAESRAEDAGTVKISETRIEGGGKWRRGTTAAYNEARDEYLVAWTREGFQEDAAGVFGRRVSGDGVPLGSEFHIGAGRFEQWPRAPVVVWNPIRDQYLVAWSEEECHSDACDPPNNQIKARRVTGVGTPIGDEIVVVNNLASHEWVAPNGRNYWDPDVAFNPDRNLYLVVFGDSHEGVRARHVRPNGNLAGEAFIVADPAGADRGTAVAYNSVRDLYQVVWANDSNDTGVRILAQRVRSNGSIVGDSLVVSDRVRRTLRSQPDIEFNPDRNEFLVVWADDRGADIDVYGQRTSSYGRLRGKPKRLSGSSGDEQHPVVGYLPSRNQYLVAWDNTLETTPGVKGRLLEATGRPTAPAFRLAGTADAELPHLAVAGNSGDALVVWGKGSAVWGTVWP